MMGRRRGADGEKWGREGVKSMVRRSEEDGEKEGRMVWRGKVS